MKILVTGAAGAIGSHLSERLLSLGHEVIGIDVLTPYYSPDIKRVNAHDVESKGGKVFKVDLSVDDLEHRVEDFDFIFHLAAQPGISAATTFDDYVKNNIFATRKILDRALKMKNLKGFVHVSTSSVYGLYAQGDETSETKPTSNYGVTKLAAEQLALSYHRSSGLPVSVLRFFSVYGERERPEKLYHKLIKAILEDRDFSLYEGSENHLRSYTHVDDIVDGCVLVMDNFHKAVGEIFNVGNDTVMTTGQGIDLIQEIIGKPARFIKLPPRSGDQKETAADISKMREVFGYSPKVSLKDGLKKEVDWYISKLHKKPTQKIGLIIRAWSKKEDSIPDKVKVVKDIVDRANKMNLFARIDIIIPTDQSYVDSDSGKMAKALSSEDLLNVTLHEIREDAFCGVRNYGMQLHYTNGISRTMFVSTEAGEYLTRDNTDQMIHAMQSGAKVCGIVFEELKNSILEGRIINSFSMWDTNALFEVGGFDLEARAPKYGEERPFAGVEEIKPLIRIVERFGRCIAPIRDMSGAKWTPPDKNKDPDGYAKFESRINSKNIRQRHYIENLGKDTDFLKDAVMSQYRQLL